MTHYWDNVVTSLREKVGTPPPASVDILEVATECGICVCGGNREEYTRIAGDCVIQVDERLPVPQLHAEVAFALAQVALWRSGLTVSEPGARYIAGKLLNEHGTNDVEELVEQVMTCRPAGRFSQAR